MIVALLSDANSAHTQKWAYGLVRAGCSVRLFSLTALDSTTTLPKECVIESCGLPAAAVTAKAGPGKLRRYIGCLRSLRRAIARWNPDIVHAHYLTSYGLLGCLCGHRRLVISAWGSDVLVFPRGSIIRQAYVWFIGRQAALLTASSDYLGRALEFHAGRPVHIVPFGVDFDAFSKMRRKSPFPAGSLVIGTIKTFEEIYGMETLVRAFIKLKQRRSLPHVKLLLIGEGSLRARMSSLLAAAALQDECLLPGRVPASEVAAWHQAIDVFVAPSLSESFGVSLVEAMACSRPIVASDIPAYREVLGDDDGGYFPPGDADRLAEMLEQIIASPEASIASGHAGYARARPRYNFEENTRQMVRLYEAVLGGSGG